MRKLLSTCAVVGGLAIATSAQASQILYYSDLNLGTDRMAQALTAVSGTDAVTTASSLSDFDTKIASGTYNLAILFEQANSGAQYDTAWAALASFIAGGGAAIGDDWSKNATHSAAFGATFTGVGNQSGFTITDPALSSGISSSVSLSNPGWLTFSTDLTGTSGAHFGDGSQAIVEGTRTFFNGFLSDTFSNGAQGTQLYVNEIDQALSATSTPVPEPASMLLLGSGLAGLMARRRMSRGTR